MPRWEYLGRGSEIPHIIYPAVWLIDDGNGGLSRYETKMGGLPTPLKSNSCSNPAQVKGVGTDLSSLVDSNSQGLIFPCFPNQSFTSL